MPENEWFKDWFNSNFYHKLYFYRDQEEANRFIELLCKHLSIKPNSRILDAACGKGRHAKILADLSFNVTGIDISPDSINEALKESSENLQFYLHDLRLPFWGNYFDYIFNFFTSFGYFRTRREHDAAMRTISRGLKPNGFFIIDYLNVHYSEDHLRENETKHIDDTIYQIERWHDDSKFYKKITITDPSLPKPLEFTEKVSKFSFGDLTDMMSFQGLQVREVFGDYELGAYDVRKSPRMIIIAEKARVEASDKEKRLYSDGRRTDAL